VSESARSKPESRGVLENDPNYVDTTVFILWFTNISAGITEKLTPRAGDAARGISPWIDEQTSTDVDHTPWNPPKPCYLLDLWKKQQDFHFSSWPSLYPSPSLSLSLFPFALQSPGIVGPRDMRGRCLVVCIQPPQNYRLGLLARRFSSPSTSKQVGMATPSYRCVLICKPSQSPVCVWGGRKGTHPTRSCFQSWL